MISYYQAKRFCNEDISLIENYDKAINDTEMWDCHHRLEIQDDKVMSLDELKNANLYFKRPSCELIFLKHDEHIRLHSLHRSEETKRKMSESRIGNTNSVGYSHTEENKKKIGAASKDRLKLKTKWMDSFGNIVEMNKTHVSRYHPDWIPVN